MNIVRHLARFPIKLYQWYISPWLGTNCRFEPSCSQFALKAIEQHGIVKGSWLTARRILRCQPFGGSGYDPVPPAKKCRHA